MIFDFNIHLPCNLAQDTQGKLGDEARLGVAELGQCYAAHRALLQQQVASGNFMLFNQDLPFGAQQGGPALDTWVRQVQQDFPAAAFTQLLDFRRGAIEPALDRLRTAGVQGVKFHSYVQKIADADIPAAVRAARAAAERGLFICIDASYGTTWMYEHDNLKLAAAIIREVDNVPVIILHSGGARRWEAMLLALESTNVYLETSFTLPFYEGSSVETDLAFIYRKIGIERVLYASDFPYVGLDDARACMQRFLRRHEFSAEEQANMLGQNARRMMAALSSTT
jgi:predicted TIM-barrel fold metal-dependent hydrolase